MDYQATKDIPPFFLEEEDTVKMLNVFQTAYELMYEDTKGLERIYDYRYAPVEFLNLMLIEAGWICKFSMDTLLKRKVLKAIPSMFRGKGMDAGIRGALLTILGINSVIDYNRVDGTFILGDMALGVDGESTLGYEGIEKFHIRVHTPTLTIDQLTIVTQVVDFMRWELNTFEIIQDL